MQLCPSEWGAGLGGGSEHESNRRHAPLFPNVQQAHVPPPPQDEQRESQRDQVSTQVLNARSL